MRVGPDANGLLPRALTQAAGVDDCGCTPSPCVMLHCCGDCLQDHPPAPTPFLQVNKWVSEPAAAPVVIASCHT